MTWSAVLQRCRGKCPHCTFVSVSLTIGQLYVFVDAFARAKLDTIGADQACINPCHGT